MESQRMEAEAAAVTTRLMAEAQAAADRIRSETEMADLGQREQAARLCAEVPAMLRFRELEALTALGQNANARLYIAFDKVPGVDADRS